MSLTNINSESLKGLIKLTQRKESLLAEIGKIESQLAALITGKPVRGAAKGKRRGRPAKKKAGRTVKSAKATRKGGRASRGGLKSRILSALKAAGDAGVKVTDLAKKIGVKNTNVHVWFSTTGKKHPDIKKVGKGHFKLVEKAEKKS